MPNDEDIEILDDDSNTSSFNPKQNNFKFNEKGQNVPINNKKTKNSMPKEKKGTSNNGNLSNGPYNGNQFKNSGNLAKISSASDAIKSNDPEEQAQALKNAGKEAIKPIVRKGVQAATGGVVGSGPVTGAIIDKAVDKVAENPNVDKIVGEVTKKIQKKKKRILLAILSAILPQIVMILLIMFIIVSPLALANEFKDRVSDVFSSIGNFLVGNGFCSDEADCQNKYAKKYFEEIDNFSNEYDNVCGGQSQWNSDLISATIFYEQMVLMNNIDISDDTESGDTSEDLIESPNTLYNYKNANKKVKELTGRLYPYLNNTSLNVNERCKANYTGYSQYLPSYIRNNFKELQKEENKDLYSIERIVQEIMAFGNQTVIANAYRGSYYCPGVTVSNSNGETISVELEDYVAGVVFGESYSQYGIEALKAQAIAARTFVLKSTNNCSKPIESSQNAQVYRENPNEKCLQAAKETEGMILRYNSELITAQYDSFCYADSDCPDSVCNDTECSVTYTKLPNEETHKVTVPIKWKSLFVAGGGHARGMSQLASYSMAENGATYDEILYTFYSPGVEIAMMGALISGSTYTSNSLPPANAEVIQERTRNGDEFYNSSKGLISQCPWYAKSRASEILYYSNLPDDLKQAAIASISSTGGHGKSIAHNMDDTLFNKSDDYTQPHDGTVVSWTADCHEFGHVAIIEKVNDDGTVLLSDGYNGGGTDAANVWSNIRYNIRNVSLDYLASHKGSNNCTFTFNGYAYLLG